MRIILRAHQRIVACQYFELCPIFVGSQLGKNSVSHLLVFLAVAEPINLEEWIIYYELKVPELIRLHSLFSCQLVGLEGELEHLEVGGDVRLVVAEYRNNGQERADEGKLTHE